MVTLAVTVAAAGAGGAAALVLAVLPRHLPAVVILGLALLVAAVGGGFALALLVALGLDLFGVMHLAYLGLVLAVPLAGAALAARVAVTGMPRPWLALAAVLVLPAPVGWYATHVEPYRLATDRVAVPLDPDRAGTDAVRIGVLADLQTNDVGPHEHEAVDRLMAAEPDLILVPGDLFQGSRREFARHEDDLRELLGRLEAPHGVYFVRGDVDHHDHPERALRDAGAVILDDEVVELSVGDRRILLGGNRLDHRSSRAAAVHRRLEAGSGAAPGEPGEPDDGTVRILVSHRPGAVLDLSPDSRVDLVVAGHTHGGQVVIPGFGPPVTMSLVPRDVARGGLHEVEGNAVYVSPGVGLERGQAPQVRLFSRPAVGVLELR